MTRLLDDEIVRRRTYTISDDACLILDSLTSYSRRKKAKVLSVAIYNLAYDTSEIQRTDDLGLKQTILVIGDRVRDLDAYIPTILGEGVPSIDGACYRRTYSYSVITRQIIDNLSMLAEYGKSRLVDMAILNLAYDIADVRRATDVTLASAVEMMEVKVGSRDMFSYVPFNPRISDDAVSDLDGFIFRGKV